MDWLLMGAIVVAGWAMLTVLSGERLGKAQRIAIALAHAAAEQAKAKEAEIPIARSGSEGIAGSIGHKPRKAA